MTETQNITLLLHMIDATSMQLATLKGSKNIGHKGKMRLNQYFDYARRFTREMEGFIPESENEGYNDQTAFVFEICKAAAMTEQPELLLALIESFNNGEVEIT